MKAMKRFILAALVALIGFSANAQQVTTLYFLENAPMRHTINPAFQPVSNGYINFTPLGWITFGFGNNSLTLSDVLFVDPITGKTVTPLHPNANRLQFMNQLRSMTYLSEDMSFGLMNMGFRIHDKGYLTIGINERVISGVTMPRSIFDFMLDGGMTDLTGGINTLSFVGLGVGTTVYTEVGAGYSYRINDKWTIGGKLKVLFGTAYAGLNSKTLALDANTEEWRLHGTLGLDVAGPVNAKYLSQFVNDQGVMQVVDNFVNSSFNMDSLIGAGDIKSLALNLIRPAGYGAAIDFGITYKPIENLQISAALTDLGAIYWANSNRFTCSMDTSFVGAGEIDYGDPAYRDENGNFSTSILMDTVVSNLQGLLNGVRLGSNGGGFAKMTSARLNIGVDANFWDNRVGIGIVSATRLYNSRLYEEITLGAAFRPVNWFNLALSYSLMNNGKYSNIGAGIGFMPYDGINLTLAMDYIPTSFAAMDQGGKKMYVLPDKMKMFNLALGVSICWGSNRRDKDKDGVWDRIDMCPDTPRGVAVDENGCPQDEDKDGVPDYQDQCPGSPQAAIGFIDENGCPRDTDGDGVPDYADACAATPQEALGYIDEHGCPRDTDGDGVPDYMDACAGTPQVAFGYIDEHGCPRDSDEDGIPDFMDACPNTAPEARAFVDERGCAKDSDGDGVEDYLDQCPNTPIEARGYVDYKGCPKDSDEDGVPDYIDACADTPAEARGFVDNKGCILDTDEDGVPDYKDECPTVPGVKANKGCPEVKREVRTLLEKAMQGIEFEAGETTIKPKSYPILDKIAQTFIENTNYFVEIQGHTDNTGNADANMQLSQDRADAVLLYLVKKGVSSERLKSVGYGQTDPIADNKTNAGRQKNRRVQFKISFEEVHIETILDHADPQETTED